MKRFLCLIIALLLLTFTVSAENEITPLYDNAPDALKDAVNDAELKNVGSLLDIKTVLNFLTDGLSDTLKGVFLSLGSLCAAALLSGLYDALADKSLADNRLGRFICASCITLILVSPIMSAVSLMTERVKELTDYMKISVPVLTGLMAASGSVSGASVLQFALYNTAIIIADIFSGTVTGIAGCYVAVGISAHLSGNSGLSRLADAIKRITIRLSVLLCLCFSGIMSLQTVLAKSGDDILRKALKTAVGASLPVGGAALSDSVGTVLSGISAIKNTGAVFAIIAVVYFMALPSLTAAINYLGIQLSLTVSGALGAENSEKITEIISGAYEILLTVIACVSFIFIAGLGAVLSGGSG